jgi:hypothetical protein
MQIVINSRPSPAIVVAVLALVAALAGTAIAGTNTLTKPVSKKTVKKIAAKQTKKLAPGLAVASADNAAALGGQPPEAYAASASEPFREVGAPGQPLFQGGCHNSGSTFSTAAFYKDSMNIVHLKGLVTCPGAGFSTAFTLPPGYRPPQDSVVPRSGSEIESYISTAGEVWINCPGGGCGMALDGFTFRP